MDGLARSRNVQCSRSHLDVPALNRRKERIDERGAVYGGARGLDVQAADLIRGIIRPLAVVPDAKDRGMPDLRRIRTVAYRSTHHRLVRAQEPGAIDVALDHDVAVGDVLDEVSFHDSVGHHAS